MLSESTPAVEEFAQSVYDGLTADRPTLDCRYLYDAEGSRLFEEITRTPEYYPTRTEDRILETYADEIRSLTGPVTIIELGSGSSSKTDRLLTAYARGDAPVLYVPIDVSQSALEGARAAIVERHPSVTVTAVVGTYEEAFPLFRRFSPSMLVFLGSTIGNFGREAARTFWRHATEALSPGDHVLLGIDLIKDPDVLNAAYNDAAGVTARFTRNLFVRMNRELDAGIDLDAVRHVAAYVPERARVEIFAEFVRDQDVHVGPLGRTVHVPAGQRILTEISRKFDARRMAESLAEYGLETRRIFTDDRDWFGVLLLQRTGA